MPNWHMRRQFRSISRRIPCAHQPAEAHAIADAILSPTTPCGPVVELGAYKGGMSAKLALACHAAGRDFYVCDTFTGLPVAEMHITLQGKVKAYQQGYYAGTWQEVWDATRGCASLIEGEFEQTLPTLAINPAVVFMDVDLISSATSCIRWLWPRMVVGGVWFVHEAGVRTFVEAIVPLVPEAVLWGAGYGLGPHAANLAYWVKPRQTD